MLNDLRGGVQEHSENFNKEMGNIKVEIKNIKKEPVRNEEHTN